MVRSVCSPHSTKTHLSSMHQSRSKGKPRSKPSLAAEIFPKNTQLLGKPLVNGPLRSKLSSSIRGPASTRVDPAKRPLRPSRRLTGNQDEGRERDLDATADFSRDWKYHVEHEGKYELMNDQNESEESENEEDWIDGSTLIAPYEEGDSPAEGDRIVALVESLQVPMQEKSQVVKEELCDLLVGTINKIRWTQQNLERGADVDRGKGIIMFDDACHKRHVDSSRSHAELKDNIAVDQLEIKKLFCQLKQAYTCRGQLWVDLKLRIDEITKRQTAILDQLEDHMERTVASLEKKGKALLKEDATKDKEKLLRGVLKKL